MSSVPFDLQVLHPVGRASLNAPVRLFAAGMLVVVAVVVGFGHAGAEEAATETPTAVTTATATSEPSSTVLPSSTVVPSSTPTVSTTPVAETDLDRLDDDLAELEGDLGSRLGDTSRQAIADARRDLNELIDFANGVESGQIQGGSLVQLELQQMANDLGASLRELRHDVQADLHGLAAGGNGQDVADIRHDLNFVKQDVDLVVRQERHEMKVGLHRNGGDADADDSAPRASATSTTSPASSPTAAAATPTAAAQATSTPTGSWLGDDQESEVQQDGVHRRGDDEDGRRDRNGRTPSLPPVVVAPLAPMVVPPPVGVRAGETVTSPDPTQVAEPPHAGKPERAEKTDTADKPERADKPETAEKSEKLHGPGADDGAAATTASSSSASHPASRVDAPKPPAGGSTSGRSEGKHDAPKSESPKGGDGGHKGKR